MLTYSMRGLQAALGARSGVLHLGEYRARSLVRPVALSVRHLRVGQYGLFTWVQLVTHYYVAILEATTATGARTW